MTIQQAIEKAKEGGYVGLYPLAPHSSPDGVNFPNSIRCGDCFCAVQTMHSHCDMDERILLDPQFWQCLERSLNLHSVEISLARKKVLVDARVVPQLIDYSWMLNRKGYIQGKTRDAKRKSIYLSRLITGAKPGEIVDHINGNILDNRSVNLRITTAQGNNSNKKNTKNGKYRGLFYRESRGTWQGVVKFQGKNHYAGNFKDKEEAAQATEALRKKLFGEQYTAKVLPWWKTTWHNMIDHLAEGNDLNSFFETLE